MTLKVTGVGVSEIANRMLDEEERKGMVYGSYRNGEYIVNRYRNHNGWSWGYQINVGEHAAACGPFWTRWGALRRAKREIRQRWS